MTLFSLSSVQFDVPGRRLIDGLSVDVPEGRVTALLGRNGSGKSTVMRLMSGQSQPSRGTVSYQGRSLPDWRGRDLARSLAYLPQVTPSTDGMYLQELVALGRYPWCGALGRLGRDDHAAIDRAIDLCGMAGLRDRDVSTLSGGERQRGWIAMMLAQGARTLLLDEPTSALDVAHQVEVLGLVQTMCHTQGLSAVIVMHDLNMAARFCDYAIALAHGKLCFQGPMEQLLRPPILHQIYGLPMQVVTGHPHPLTYPIA
ncbi:iron ABC transporter substrate-binding protein [Thioclava sp. SK-1]|uniref:ABC transporter ATP-binding protein n=1 Tax=Thioclava sp. SK-1 TaxID=1889770 RepID=UPI000825DDE9|nr:ATP-binding cassette domain-containing protein [Thioclava sp. SK-1]OCX66529.1 iron ABC transporter substrate-binding protein [Thioclava sp. SK-1]